MSSVITVNENNKIKRNIVKRIKKTMNEKILFIPKLNEYESFIINTYKVSQLKEICRHYKLKLSGNKNELVSRIYNYLKLSYNVIKIQRTWKVYINKIYNSLRGPARFKRDLCVNETDFLSMESIKDICYTQFISYKDYDDMTYGFEIVSLYNLIHNNTNNNKKYPENPYNRNRIPTNIIYKINKLLKLARIFNDKICIKMEDNYIIDENKRYELRILNIFQEIDNLGNYTDHSWFCDISNNRVKLIKFIRELADIWSYRAQLTYNTKKEICPPSGCPFSALHINLNSLQVVALNILQNNALSLIELFVRSGINTESRCLGTNYILCALTLVNTNAANSMPWLYQSVAHLD